MHEYLRRINKSFDRGIIDKDSAALVEVHHDAKGKKRCQIYLGGDCNCDPDIILTTADGQRHRMDREGLLKRVLNA